MIAAITGRLRSRDSNRIVVETGGIGYEVFVPLSTFYRLPMTGAAVSLEIRQVVREDALMLYGFIEPAEKLAFDLLMRVQHVGPKLALAILSVLSPEELVAAIGREDVARIDAVPGVGPKVAERVVRELRDKIADLKTIAPAAESLDGAAAGNGSGDARIDDAVSALVNLGYRPIEAKRAVDSIIKTARDATLEKLIRDSLTLLLGEK
ncbi:MAG: Holliday junction branch migration protein RuvA [Candidatus Binataceae bacterium]|nr:Holliday junction branch migration protein RuvA [Candidatus Binataceae bacterium]